MAVSVEALFHEIFLPLYPEDVKRALARVRSEDANPANNPHILASIDDVARVFVGMASATLGLNDESLALDYTDASVHRLSRALTPERRDHLFEQGKKGTAENVLFNFVVHGAAYVGACIVQSHGGVWSVRRPLWESKVRLSSRAGDAELPIFHWWLKSLADLDPNPNPNPNPNPEAASTSVVPTLADRYRTYVEVPCAKPEELPIIASPDERELPRLSKVRYDVLYKYLKAHLPEIRDVGEAFPSPERFAELEFKHLSFDLIGGGRMLLIHGPNKDGLHAFWLTKDGFEKSAFWPCEAFPAPLMRVKGELPDQKIDVILSHKADEPPVTQEILWWGP